MLSGSDSAEKSKLTIWVRGEYLQHFCHFEGSDVLVDVEVILLDEQDVGGGEHVAHPLRLHPHFAFLRLLQQQEAQRVIAGEGSHEVAIALAGQF